ncbi:restriction endonuclease subunit S [Arthrobacter sp. MPF02]|uniref:restriction endonuclease subunit S n=1 Tax=Arthrobacter sp. MPF02 TaxID=3388492 RepID=UPI003984D497
MNEGEAPWREVTLGSIASVTRGASPRPINSPRWFSSDSTVGWVRISDVSRSNGRTLNETSQKLSQEGIARSRYLQPGTLIMSIAATVGVPVITGIPSCIHDGFVALEDLSVDKRFLLYQLKASERELRSSGQAGSQANVNTSIVKALTLRVPSDSAEQRRIAQAMNDVDELISGIERLVTKKKAIKLGILQELLTGRKRLPGWRGDWTETTVGSLGSMLKGRGIRRDDVRQSGVPCIRYGELYTTYQDYTGQTVSYVDPDMAATALPIHYGDLLFAGSGETKEDIGMCLGYVGQVPAVAGGDIIVLRGQGYDPVFMASLLNLPALAGEKARAGQGDAVVHISSRAIAALKILIPSLPEQSAIAEAICNADQEVRILLTKLEKMNSIRQGMMQELLTGRTRLKDHEVVM